MARRVVWSENEKRALLLVLIGLLAQGFDPNDSASWFIDNNAAAILQGLRQSTVRDVWLDSIDKVRRKYMNIKADYNRFQALDQRHTGGGVRVGFPMEELVEQLVNPNDPIARPPLITDNGFIQEDADHPANADPNGPAITNDVNDENVEPIVATEVQNPPSPATF